MLLEDIFLHLFFLCILSKSDILAVAKKLFDMKTESAGKDDIDHLGNRRVRSVGELIENQYRITNLLVINTEFHIGTYAMQDLDTKYQPFSSRALTIDVSNQHPRQAGLGPS